MAKKKSTRNTRPPKIPGEHRLTVRDQIYSYPERLDGSRREDVKVPWLQMRGHWLAAAGFDIRTPVRVRVVMRGCLVLTAEDGDE